MRRLISTHKFLGASVALFLLFAVPHVAQFFAPVNPHYDISLYAPSFIASASAEVNGSTPFEDEAGISAYFNANSAIVLADVREAYRTIEDETAEYIIGSVEVPGYAETEDVHVYVHVDGWLLAYYLAEDPASKIADLEAYEQTGTFRTKFANVLAIVSAAAGVPLGTLSYYDFRHPNANQMTIIVEEHDEDDRFTVELPGTFIYYERSASSYQYDLFIDDVTVLNCGGGGRSCHTEVPASQLLPDVPHTVRVYYGTFGALGLVYRVP